MRADQAIETVPANLAEWDEVFISAKADGRILPNGKGWIKREVLAKHWKLSLSRTSDRAGGLIRRGRAERFEGKDIGPSGCLVRAVWFRLKPSK